MSDLVTDPNDPRLGHGVDKEKISQHEAYLILSEEERSKGFIRPVRRTYVHLYTDDGSPVPYPLISMNGIKGYGGVTTMSKELAETYARNPKFYGATYCVGCQKHLDVNEFIWDGTSEKVGS